MFRLQRYEPHEVPRGTPVTVLVTPRVGPWVFIPLHALPEAAAVAVLFEWVGENEQTAAWWRECRAIEENERHGPHERKPARMLYVVGSAALEKMREVLELAPGDPWPADVEVVRLYG